MPFQPIRDPTPEEIEAGCDEIRKTWSEEETYRRKGMPVRGRQPGSEYIPAWQKEWTPPIVRDFDPWALIDSFYRDF